MMVNFIQELAPFAIKHGKAGNVLPSLIMAQGILESGMGRSTLTVESNNLFGIKKGSGWTGEVYAIETREWSQEKGWYTVIAEFRKYPSYEGSVIDLVNLYQRERYAAVIGEMNYIKATEATWRAGYATDPTYPEKLQNVIELYKLNELIEGEGENMTVSVFTLLDKSEKAMSGVNEKVKALALELVRLSYHNGIYVQITSGFRSNAEQTRLYNQGRFGNGGNIVTNAKAGQSIHNYGLAIDYALANNSGIVHWNLNQDMNENDAKDWFEVAAIGKKLGFQWGGDWPDFRDYPHLDMQRGMSLSQLAAGKRPSIPAVPDRGYYGLGDSGTGVKRTQSDLTKAGYPCDADGYFGNGTEAIVKRFQKANGLVVDGFYGKSSEGKIKAILNKLNEKTAKPIQKPVEKPKEEEEMEKTAVVINGTADAGTATLLAFQLGCGVFFRKDAESRQVAKEIYIAGGGKGKIKGDKLIDLSGKTRSDTAKNVTAQLK